jgi:LytS/YehU family sensor histidine kinase
MSDKMPTNIHIREFEDDMGIPHTATCSENNPKGKEYTLVHNNTDYHIIPKGENIICQGSMMYNPNSHKIVDLDEYHIIPKADVDGDVMGALDALQNDGETWTQRQYDLINQIRNALIAQSKKGQNDE